MNYELVETRKNGHAYLIENYLFNRHSSSNNTRIYLKCREKSCPVKAIIRNDLAEYRHLNVHHTHSAPDLENFHFRADLRKDIAKPEGMTSCVQKLVTEKKRSLVSKANNPDEVLAKLQSTK